MEEGGSACGGGITLRLLTVYLTDKACALALARAFPDGSALRPGTRAAIQRARTNRDLLDIRDVACTADRAQELTAYFGSWAEALATLDRGLATLCAEAKDAAEQALKE